MYDRDSRVVAGRNRTTYEQDHQNQTINFSVIDDTEDEVFVVVPGKYEVCRTCDGKGKHVNPSIDSDGISPEQFHEDPGFEEEYFAGTYDVQCYDCSGRTTVLVPDEDSMTDDHKRLLEMRQEEDIADAQYAHECAMERRMGA